MNDKREKFLLVRIRVFKDEGAFGSLVEEYSHALQRFLYSKLPDVTDVEDAYSTLLMKLWEYTTSTHVDHFSGLAYTIARRIIAEFYRSREKESHLPISDHAEEDGIQMVDEVSAEQLEDRIDVTLIKEALKKLKNEDEQEVIILRYIEGYPVKEIAKYLSKTQNATSVLLNRALKKVRTIIESKGT